MNINNDDAASLKLAEVFKGKPSAISDFLTRNRIRAKVNMAELLQNPDISDNIFAAMTSAGIHLEHSYHLAQKAHLVPEQITQFMASEFHAASEFLEVCAEVLEQTVDIIPRPALAQRIAQILEVPREIG